MQFRKRIVPGGAARLQIWEGPRAGPWWVRLPLSSARYQKRQMTPLFLTGLTSGATLRFFPWQIGRKLKQYATIELSFEGHDQLEKLIGRHPFPC